MLHEVIPGDELEFSGIVDNKPLIMKLSNNVLKYKIIGDSILNMREIHLPVPGARHMNNGMYESLVVNQKEIWVLGNYFVGAPYQLNHLISLNKLPKEGPKLPFTTICGHSMVQIDTKTIYIIGGYKFATREKTEETWVIDPSSNYDFKPGPSLKKARSFHACATMILNGRIFIIIAGGQASQSVLLWGCNTTVEILDTSNPTHGWMEGPTLPTQLRDFTMVTSPTRKGIVIIGGSSGYGGYRQNEYLDALYELSGDSIDTLKWTRLEQKLQIARYNHFSFYIPNQVCKDINSIKSN